MSMPTLGDMSVRLGVDLSGFNKDLDTAKGKLNDVGSSATKSGGGIKSLVGNMLGVAGGIGIVAGVSTAFSALTGFIGDSVAAAKTAQVTQATLVQTIKATGGVAGVTADSADKLAESLSKVTDFSADTTLSAENMLLTFRNIGQKNGVFAEATQTTLDMAQVFGSTQTASIQLGKALNDPLTGISALARVGVTFDAQQKQSIKTFMAQNNIAGAQGVILKELSHEFGGVAEAAGNTLAGKMQILNNQWQLTEEKVGNAVIPLMGDFLNAVTPVGEFIADHLVSAVDNLSEGASKLSPFLSDIGNDFQFISTPLEGVGTTLGSLAQDIFPSAKNASGDLSGALGNLKNILGPVHDLFQNVGEGVQGFDIWLNSVVTDIRKGHSPFGALGTDVNSVWSAFTKFGAAIGKNLQGDMTSVGSLVTNSVVPGFQKLSKPAGDIANTLAQDVVPAFLNLGTGVVNLATALQPGIVNAINAVSPKVTTLATDVGTTLDGAFKGVTPDINKAGTALTNFAKVNGPNFTTGLGNMGAAVGHFIDFFQLAWTDLWPALSGITKNGFGAGNAITQLGFQELGLVFQVGMDLLSGKWGQAWHDWVNGMGNNLNSMKNMVSDFFNFSGSLVHGFLSVVQNVLGNIRDGWDNLWSSLTKVKITLPHIPMPHFSISGSFGINPPSVPSLSVQWYKQGGIFNSPQVIGVGEGSEPEAVTPLSELKKMLGDVRGKGGNTYNINVNNPIDEQRLAMLIRRQELLFGVG